MNITIVIGSLRQGSYNRKIAEQFKEIAPSHWQIHEVKLDDLPLYNADFDEQTIDSYERVRGQIKAADGVVFFTPEYNRSLPAALKNMIDIATRPAGQNLWAGKKVAISSASTGRAGGNLAAAELQKVCFMLGMQVSSMMANFSLVSDSFNEQGEMTDQRAKQVLQQFANQFAAMFTTSSDNP